MDEYNSDETFSTTPPTDFITLAHSVASNGYQISIYRRGVDIGIFHTDPHPIEDIKLDSVGFSLIENQRENDTVAYSKVKDDIIFVIYTSSSRLDASLSNLIIALVSLITIIFFISFFLGYIFARDALLPVRILINDIS